jgi:phage-related minor tail protein
MVDLASNEIAGPALEAVEGLNSAMKGLHNAGILDQEMFLGLTGQISSTFKTLVDQGAEGNTALMMMSPSLQTIWELQKDFGYAVDEGTQLLLDQAVTAGIVGEKHRSVEERVLAVLERIAEVLGADLPDAAREAERAAVAAADKIEQELNDIKLEKLILEAEAQVHWNYDAFNVPDVTYDPWDGEELMGSLGGLVTNSGIQTLAHGGMVRGYARGTDSVPALLTPGEAVLTTRAVGTLGTGAISQLNRGGSLSNADVIAELRALRKQQAASDRQLPLLVALSVRDAMQLQR